jgi:uncharacterized protein (DUF1778 family)
MPVTEVPARRVATSSSATRRDAVINLRVPAKTRDLIDAAADSLGKTRTEFVVETARQHAIDVLLDQRLFLLNDEDFADFNQALDTPAEPNAELKALMGRKKLWEK